MATNIVRVYAAPANSPHTYHHRRDCKWIVDVDDAKTLDISERDSLFTLRTLCKDCS